MNALKLILHITIWATVLLAPAHGQITRHDIYVGLLLNSPFSELEDARNLDQLKAEIQKVLGPGHAVHFQPAHFRFSEGDLAAAHSAYGELVQDNAIDLILSVGATNASMLASLEAYTKPTIAIGVLDPVLQKMPYAEPGISGTPGFTYLLNTHSIQKDLEVFHRVHPFRRLGVLVDENIRGAFDVDAFFGSALEPFDASVQVAYITDGVQNAISRLNPETDAVFLANIYDLGSSQVDSIASILRDRRIPSFALRHEYVEAGLLACAGNRNNRNQAMRKLALTVEAVVLGEDLARLPVLVAFDRRVTLNALTAKQIGLSIPFEMLYSARILQSEAPAADRILSLDDVVLEGL